jgi:hypothetical protein
MAAFLKGHDRGGELKKSQGIKIQSFLFKNTGVN